jgi:cell division protein FtsN
LAQDDYFYEIQLTNKQLVFYFLAGATGLVLSFLAGVMVGRGVDQTASADVQATRPVIEDRIVTEEATTTTRPAAPLASDLTYAQRLEGEKQDESLEKPASEKAAVPQTTVAPKAAAPATTKPAPAATKAPAALATFTIQVGAFKDRASAESVVERLKKKGFSAYVVAPEGPDGGLFNVRVGSYPARADAERIQAKLRDEEKFKPFIVRN